MERGAYYNDLLRNGLSARARARGLALDHLGASVGQEITYRELTQLLGRSVDDMWIQAAAADLEKAGLLTRDRARICDAYVWKIHSHSGRALSDNQTKEIRGLVTRAADWDVVGVAAFASMIASGVTQENIDGWAALAGVSRRTWNRLRVIWEREGLLSNLGGRPREYALTNQLSVSGNDEDAMLREAERLVKEEGLVLYPTTFKKPETEDDDATFELPERTYEYAISKGMFA